MYSYSPSGGAGENVSRGGRRGRGGGGEGGAGKQNRILCNSKYHGNEKPCRADDMTAKSSCRKKMQFVNLLFCMEWLC